MIIFNAHIKWYQNVKRNKRKIKQYDDKMNICLLLTSGVKKLLKNINRSLIAGRIPQLQRECPQSLVIQAVWLRLYHISNPLRSRNCIRLLSFSNTLYTKVMHFYFGKWNNDYNDFNNVNFCYIHCKLFSI